jgi:hypothetical protein
MRNEPNSLDYQPPLYVTRIYHLKRGKKGCFIYASSAFLTGQI